MFARSQKKAMLFILQAPKAGLQNLFKIINSDQRADQTPVYFNTARLVLRSECIVHTRFSRYVHVCKGAASFHR
jgi:hypothetical protein